MAGKRELSPPASSLPPVSPSAALPLPPASPLRSPPALTSFDVLRFTAAGNGEPGEIRGVTALLARAAPGRAGGRMLCLSPRSASREAPRTPLRQRWSPLEGEGGRPQGVAVRSSGGAALFSLAVRARARFPLPSRGANGRENVLAGGLCACLAEGLAGPPRGHGPPAVHRQPPALCAGLRRLALFCWDECQRPEREAGSAGSSNTLNPHPQTLGRDGAGRAERAVGVCGPPE